MGIILPIQSYSKVLCGFWELDTRWVPLRRETLSTHPFFPPQGWFGSWTSDLEEAARPFSHLRYWTPGSSNVALITSQRPDFVEYLRR